MPPTPSRHAQGNATRVLPAAGSRKRLRMLMTVSPLYLLYWLTKLYIKIFFRASSKITECVFNL